jgi:hypothetical protein
MESREEKSRAFTRRTVIWGAVAYIAMALFMSGQAGMSGVVWYVFLILPSFVAGVAVAAVKGDGGFVIPVSECQIYDPAQVGGCDDDLFPRREPDYITDPVYSYMPQNIFHNSH